jgi:hypothetical protein
VTLGGLQTTNATANAVEITSREGGIVDGGDTHVDIAANAAGSVVTLNAATGIGHGNALETTLHSLDAVNRGIGVTGDISISESDGLIILRVRQEAPGGAIGISVVAGGLTVASGHAGVTSSGHGNIELSSGGVADLRILSNVSSYGGDITVRSGGDLRVGDFGAGGGAAISATGAGTMLAAGGVLAGSTVVSVTGAAGFFAGQQVEIIEGEKIEVATISSAADAVNLAAGQLKLTSPLMTAFTKAARVVARQSVTSMAAGAVSGATELVLSDVSQVSAGQPIEILAGGVVRSVFVSAVNNVSGTVSLAQPLLADLAAGSVVYRADGQTLSLRANRGVYLAEGVLLSTDDLSVGSASQLRSDRLEVRADADDTFVGTGVRDGLFRVGERLQLRTDGGVAMQFANRPLLGQSAAAPYAFFVDLADPLESNVGAGGGFNYLATFKLAIPTEGEENLRMDIDWRDPTSATGGIESRYFSYVAGGVPQSVEYTYALGDFVAFISKSIKEFLVDFSVGHHETISVTADSVQQGTYAALLLGSAADRFLDERGVSTTDQGPVTASTLGVSLSSLPVGKFRGEAVLSAVDSNGDFHFEGGTVLIKIPTPPFQPIATASPMKPLPQFVADAAVPLVLPQSPVEVPAEELPLLESPSARSEDRYEIRQQQAGGEQVLKENVPEGDRLLNPVALRKYVAESDLAGQGYELWLVTRKRTSSGGDILIERQLLKFDVNDQREPFPSPDPRLPLEAEQPLLVPIDGPVPGVEGVPGGAEGQGTPENGGNCGPEVSAESVSGIDHSDLPSGVVEEVSRERVSGTAGRLAVTAGLGGMVVSRAIRQGTGSRRSLAGGRVSRILRRSRAD